MEKACIKCSSNFIVDQDDQSFYEKMKVPVPNVCPDCRFKMKALFRNEMRLYSGRKCDLCEKSIVTMYSPKSPYIVYCYECFYSEKWDPKSYAMEYDQSRSFLDQLKEFLIKVPKIAAYLTSGLGPNINSEYANMSGACKNCYLVFNTGPAEEVMYSRGISVSSDCVDMYFGTDLDRCYESINTQKSSGVLWGHNVVGCVDSVFILNGSGLTNCFGCVNLRNKSNCFFNEQLTSTEYKKRISEIMGSHEKIQEYKERFTNFVLQFPQRENSNLKTLDSTGNYLFECKDVKDSFEVGRSENCHYIFSSKDIKDSIGTIGHGRNSEMMLEVVATGLSSNVIGSYGLENCRNVMYSFYIENCQDCIGCDSLKHGKYSIFNKEYPKQEYEILKEKIISELIEAGLYGLMMPPELAPFAYNETIAQDNFPLTKEEVLALGFRWEDDIQMTKGKETMLSEDIPDHVKDVQDLIIAEVLKCVDCERNYKITGQELLFYRKMNLPIPRKCFYCRHQDRIVRRGPYKFWERNCAHCNNIITTNYSPDRPEIIYCEQCYQQEVI